MPDYSKCVIYTIKTGDGLYVGSTCNFNNRKYQHKYNINYEDSEKYKYKLYEAIRANEGAWDMQPHAVFPCNSKMEMAIEEERVRKELKANLNSQSCYGNVDIKEYYKEYYKANKDKYLEYRLDNKEKNKQYQKEYYSKNKHLKYIKDYQAPPL